MMNLGVVLPEPGYLEAVREHHAPARHRADLRRGQDRPLHRGGRRDRAIRRHARHGHPGEGARRRAADGRDRRHRGGRSRSSRTAASTRSAPTTGTRSSMAAARASLLEVLTPEAYEHLDALERAHARRLPGRDREARPPGLRGRDRLEGLRHVLAERRSSTTRRFKANQDAELAELAWLYNMNRGIFMTPGREEEWTLSVAHTPRTATRTSRPSRRWRDDLTG